MIRNIGKQAKLIRYTAGILIPMILAHDIYISSMHK